MCDSKVLHLKFVGMDSWTRPVYKDDSGTLWKDVDPRARMQPDLCTSVNNEFDGEPDIDMKYLEKYQGVTIAFEPERIASELQLKLCEQMREQMFAKQWTNRCNYAIL